MQKTPSQARPLLEEAWKLAIKSEDDLLSIEILQLFSIYETPKFKHKWIQKAIHLAKNSKSNKAKQILGILYFDLGQNLDESGRHRDSLQAYQDAYETYGKFDSSLSDVYRTRLAIGRQTRLAGKVRDALVIQRILVNELGSNNLQEARLYEELAECLHHLGEEAEARQFFEQAYREFSKESWVPDKLPLRLKRMKDLGKVKKI